MQMFHRSVDINRVKYRSMLVLETISLILGIVVVGSICLWLGLMYRLWAIGRTKSTILEGLTLPVPTDEQVSIVVPAHNEERVLDRCAAALRNQKHTDLQIIFVLDRCDDRSLEILQKHADEDERICIIENNHCPDDWAGKCNAAKIGAEKATGKWLLFTDADTQFDSELVRCSLASAIKRNASLLSILSSLTITKNFERIVQPVASTFLVRQYPVDRINREHGARPFANGQFLLFTRAAYEEIGGHESVKDDLLEDIAFARLLHRFDKRVQVLFSDGMLKCSMYPTFAAFKNGWKRIYIEASSRKIKRLKQNGWLAIIATLLLPIAGISGIFVGQITSPTLYWTSITSLIAYVFVIAWLYKINNAPIIFALFAPLGGLVVARLFFNAATMLQQKTPIVWGGKEYILEPNE